jgi:hypothetical protein
MIATGKREVMLIMMMSDVPFPMPRCVIWSANHIMNNDAEVIQIVVMMVKARWLSVVTICVSAGNPMFAGFSNTVDNAAAWNTQIAIVR